MTETRKTNNTGVNRQVKDRLFRAIFSNKEDLLELYNAVNHSDYSNPEELEITTLEDVVYMGMKNDVSFIVDDILNLYEHQSTFNPNMPLRGFMYISEIYKGIIGNNEKIYGTKLVHLPLPKYIVFYNGTKEEPETLQMSIKDAFDIDRNEESCLDFRATMLNINYGHNKELLERSKKLKDYSRFIDEIRNNLGKGMNLRISIDKAVDYCIRNDILADILTKNRSEVRNMILTEYDEKKFIESQKEEWKQEGIEQGIELTKKIFKLSMQGKSISEIAQSCEISEEEVENILR